MNDENKKLPFGNSINEHDPASTRVLFVNPNGLDLYKDSHRLTELLIKSKPNKMNILLLAERNTHWKNKRASDLFRNIIAKYWKEAVNLTSETTLN